MKKKFFAPAVVLAMSGIFIVNPVKALANDHTAEPSASTTESKPVSSAAGSEYNVSSVPSDREDQSKYTAPNNVENEVTDENKQGTTIDYNTKLWGFIPIKKHADITPDDVDQGKKLSDISEDFSGDLGDTKADDLVIKGDLSIAKEGKSNYDTEKDTSYKAEKNEKYTLKADLDVSQIHTAITATGKIIDNSDSVYINNLETGMRATFTLNNNIKGEFFVPKTEEEMERYYQLTSADGNPLIYKINFLKSVFTPTKVTIVMDLDLSQMGPLDNVYPYAGAGYKKIYGEGNAVENFNHPESEYGTAYQTSVFGNLKNLITHSAQQMAMFLHGITIQDVLDQTDVSETRQGTIQGTLTGYLKADTGHSRTRGKVAYVWGAMQEASGKDAVQEETDRAISLTVQVTDPQEPDVPDQPDTPVTPEKPSKPSKQEVIKEIKKTNIVKEKAAQTTEKTIQTTTYEPRHAKQESGVHTGISESMTVSAMGITAAGLGLVALRRRRKDQD